MKTYEVRKMMAQMLAAVSDAELARILREQPDATLAGLARALSILDSILASAEQSALAVSARPEPKKVVREDVLKAKVWTDADLEESVAGFLRLNRLGMFSAKRIDDHFRDVDSRGAPGHQRVISALQRLKKKGFVEHNAITSKWSTKATPPPLWRATKKVKK